MWSAVPALANELGDRLTEISISSDGELSAQSRRCRADFSTICQVSEVVDQSAVLHCSDEEVRTHNAAFGVTPSRQSFCTFQLTCGEINFGLKKRFELTSGKPLADFFQCK